ncbi:aminotransferase class I/II-fold pyridoxal phosphate-dependent enzyme [Cellulosilyticum sp. I15G10I2]|uniref:aminotransferase class I/II-fold pyridoxal phosphate-dependent enzyme n=1 Tax=Cellulosilyticum sp. I15G10I2 TaxID=1892843 RepID=UPI00085C11F6|nr:aminotransferase class I/II-fold pyridoxal phosphate-dependent enzyme [Cellulosilyticum sp. I15G10I2]
MSVLCSNIETLAKRYLQEIEKSFNEADPAVLIYGSSVNGNDNSDIDICIILHQYGEEEQNTIKKLTIKFHKDNNLKLDDEVPFEQKCIFSYYDIEKVVRIPPFPIFRSKFRIPRIDKSEVYLSSNELKYRLLLNILTTNSVILRGNEKAINIYKNMAWETLIRVIFSYTGNSPIKVDQFVEYLCKNPYGDEEGEHFLGYSRKNEKLYIHLINTCERIFDRLVREEKMLASQPSMFACDKNWLRQFEISTASSFLPDDTCYKLMEYEKMNGHDFSENANPLGPTEYVQNALKQCSVYINIYPDYKNIEANNDLSKFFSVPIENVAIANGSLEAIFALPKLLDSSAATVVVPTYWGYEAALQSINAKYRKLYLEGDLEFDDDKINEVASESTILFICNPNNPTSSYIEKDRICKIIEKNKNCHFIIDESHLMLHNNFFNETLCGDVEKLGNVSIVYSLSKLFSVAGLRVGALISNKEVVDKYKKWQVPYSLSTISQVLFPICINDEKFVDRTRKEIHVLVEELYKELCGFDWLNVKPSVTNFILCEITGGITAIELANKLKNDGFYIRELTTCYPDLKGEWIRISVNTRELNKQLISVIKNYNITK